MRSTKLVTLALILFCARGTYAVDIRTVFTGGSPPANKVGGGNIEEIFEAAARVWERAYQDSFTLTLYYGWAPCASSGEHILLTQGGAPNREISGQILFDNSGATSFFLDPTPFENEEYLRMTEEFQDLGGGLVSVARVYRNPAGDAAGHCDLFSVALHEIGHALGLCAANLSFAKESVHKTVEVLGGLPYAGTIIPLAVNYSGLTPHIDAVRVPYGPVMAGVSSDERRMPSALDILANAQISGFSALNLSLQLATDRVPMPYRPIKRESAGSSGN